MRHLIAILTIMILTACCPQRGPRGYTGEIGVPGSTGLTGTPGIDATSVTTVNFCTGTTVYPTTFLEVGFCINNQLYAVYSEHDGFLVLIPPGSYSSNAHGSSCNFTVLPNCVIEH